MTETKPKGAPVLLSADYWGRDGERYPAGTVAVLPLADAKAIIAAGKAVRADPMPGEE